MKHTIYSPTNVFFNALVSNREFTGNQLSAFFKTISHTFATWRERSTSRRHLKNLNAHLLDDIGVTQFEARCETVKLFWLS